MSSFSSMNEGKKTPIKEEKKILTDPVTPTNQKPKKPILDQEIIYAKAKENYKESTCGRYGCNNKRMNNYRFCRNHFIIYLNMKNEE